VLIRLIIGGDEVWEYIGSSGVVMELLKAAMKVTVMRLKWRL
jgi:hypothetical protein